MRSYEDPAFQLPARAFQVARLGPFDDAKIDAFVDAWYAEVAARWQVPAVKAQEKAAKLRTAVRRADLRDLAPNPLLLTVMALVHTQRGELPQARARLYDEAIDVLPTGYVLRLPTEAEWECAARGATGRRYAWGDGWDPARANVNMTIGSSSPVGAFPGGATPTGVMDLTGNCWEWCLSAIGDYPYRPDKQRNEPERNTRRVLRGGAWGGGRHVARAAYRDGDDPDDFSSHVGFRLVLSLADSEF